MDDPPTHDPAEEDGSLDDPPDRAVAEGAPPRRKVLLYIHALAGGGAERVWALLATGLAALGHEVVLAVDYEAVENLAALSARVRLVVLGRGHLAGTWRLARLIRRERPDVTLSALAAGNAKHALAALAAGRARRAILTYHGYPVNERGLLSRLGYLATPLLARTSARTVAVSDGLARYLRRRLAVPSRRLARVYNPVQWGPAGPGEALDPPVVLAVGRLDAQKDHLTLLRAFARVERRDARLVILGEGPERGAIEAEARRLGLAGRVSLPGYVAEPWARFAAARCFVLSSRVEAFGLVVVEALAHGLPVVATDCDGPREILAGEGLGALVPVGDVGAMALAIEAALAEPGEPERRRRRAADFAPERALAAYGALIDEVAHGADRAGRRPARAALAPGPDTAGAVYPTLPSRAR